MLDYIFTNYLNNYKINPSQIGIVLRSHAGGYLVHRPFADKTILCQAKARIKKESLNILTGDIVSVEEFDENLSNQSHKGIITEVYPRMSLLKRPAIANVNQVVLVKSLQNPTPNLNLLDKLLLHFELSLDSVDPIICFNKADLASIDTLELVKNVYMKLNYKLCFVSALTGYGIDSLLGLLENKITVFAGPSGVGKSSLLNVINPHLSIATASELSQYGRHTTTATQLYEVKVKPDSYLWIADTPGFNLEELDCPKPNLIAPYFNEIYRYADLCKYNDCLHLNENGCHVIENLDKIHKSRYKSYQELVLTAKEKYNASKIISSKNENAVKTLLGKKNKITKIPKIEKSQRFNSKSQTRQKAKMSYLFDLSENHLDTDEDSKL